MKREKYTRFENNIKKVIFALKKGKKTWTELQKSTQIPETTLHRALHFLQSCKLIIQEDGYWTWSEYVVFNNESELTRALDHSKLLIPTLDDIVNVTFNPEDPLFKDVEKHLMTGYPEIHKKLENFLKLRNEKSEELLRKHSKKVTEWSHRNYEYQPYQILPELKFYPSTPDWAERRNAIMKDLEPLLKAYKELAGEVSSLKLKITMGNPLKGSCENCPKVKVQEGKS